MRRKLPIDSHLMQYNNIIRGVSPEINRIAKRFIDLCCIEIQPPPVFNLLFQLHHYYLTFFNILSVMMEKIKSRVCVKYVETPSCDK